MGGVDVAGSFRGEEIFEGWLATGETEQTESGTTSSKRKKKTYAWSARSAEGCLEDLLTLVSALKTNIVER